MTNDIQTTNIDPATLEKLVTAGDLSGLTPAQRVLYYRARCEAAGLDYRTQPFRYMTTDGKLSLYADKTCSDQLAARDRISTKIISKAFVDDMYVVEVEATNAQGRGTSDIGAVSVKGVGGTNLANAMMKAVTKAKRRSILSLCGLGLPDESEVDGNMRTIDVTPNGEVLVPDFLPRIQAARSMDDLDRIATAMGSAPLDQAERATLNAAFQARAKELSP